MAAEAKPEHEIAFQALNAMLKELCDKHDLSNVELLAVASNMLGKILAMQDQRHMSVDRAMRIIRINIEIGNAQAVAALRDAKPTGSA